MDMPPHSKRASIGSHRSQSFDIEDATRKCRDELVRARILIAGPPGSGKSSLVNRIFYKNHSRAEVSSIVPGNADINKPWEDETRIIPILIHDSKGAARGDPNQYNKVMKSFLNKRGPSASVSERIHCVWYLLNLNGRLEPHDVQCCRELFKGIPLIIVLTKRDEVREERETAFYEEISRFKPPHEKVFSIYNSQAEGFKKEPRFSCKCNHGYSFDRKMYMCNGCGAQSTGKPKNQLADLIRYTLKLVPMEAIPSVVKSLPSKRKRILGSIAIITSFGCAAAGLGFSPIPFSDIILIIPVQAAMCCALSYAWGFPPWKENGILSTVLSYCLLQSGTTCAGLLATNFLKFIPIVGTLSGAVSNCVIGGTLTVCLGISYVLILSKVFDKFMKSHSKDLHIPQAEYALMLQEYLDPNFIRKIFEKVKLIDFKDNQRFERVCEVLESVYESDKSAIPASDRIDLPNAEEKPETTPLIEKEQPAPFIEKETRSVHVSWSSYRKSSIDLAPPISTSLSQEMPESNKKNCETKRFSFTIGKDSMKKISFK